MEKFKKYEVYFYIAFAYLFGIALRYIWIIQVGDDSSYYWNNQIMINTNDGYFFATAVKNLLFSTNPYNQLLPGAVDTYTGTIYSVYFLAKILPFSLDTIILYLPAFISSLIVIPIILIMRLFNLTFVGFLASLLAVITWSFYNRTMIGYFDTDMYALVFPVYILYFIFRFVKFNRLLDILIASVITSFYVVFYPQGYAAITAIFITFIAYGLIFIKDKTDFYLSITLMSISLIKIALAFKLTILITLYLIYKKVTIVKEQKYPLYLAIIFFAIFVLAGDGYELIISKIEWYTKTGVEGGSLHFYDVAQTISEAGKIPFKIFADRISGSVISFIIAVVGYIVLVIRRKEFLLFLPLIAIGFFAYKGGLRFTVYAIPAMAIGAVYLFWEIAQTISKESKARYAFLILATTALLYPNITHLIDYGKRIRTVFSRAEVEDLDKLKNISKPKDYTLTWWDYGYPIWYYSETNTLIDGGKHHHDNYIISKIMQTTSSAQAANLSRLSVEKYVEKKLGYSPVADVLIKESNLSANEFLASLKNRDYKLPSKTRDVYLYMPLRMANIFSTVMLFGNLDLTTGKKLREAMFYPAYLRAKKGDMLMLSNGLVIDAKKGLVYFGRNALKIKYLVETKRDSSGEISVSPSIYNKDGVLALLYLKSTGQLIVMDMQTFNSMYVQMGLLGNYDKDLFELLIKSPYSRIYKLKR